jgi:hypothetical protein
MKNKLKIRRHLYRVQNYKKNKCYDYHKYEFFING